MSGAHYKHGIETIAVMEQVMEQPGELPPKQRMLVAQALKYLLRAGVKAGVPWQDDLLKALDYVFRAENGVWWHRRAQQMLELTRLRLEEDRRSTLMGNILGLMDLDANMPLDNVMDSVRGYLSRLRKPREPSLCPRPQTPAELRQQAAELRVQAWEIESGTVRPCDPGTLVRIRLSEWGPGVDPVEGPANVFMEYDSWYMEVGGCIALAQCWDFVEEPDRQ